mmetsp:Transcript_63587/g.170282  ORF Transcript_63587/g.170282 Transcript_63587/m.170282 type:complete len:354 (+) Transcript_63587:86-1147(+)
MGQCTSGLIRPKTGRKPPPRVASSALETEETTTTPELAPAPVCCESLSHPELSSLLARCADQEDCGTLEPLSSMPMSQLCFFVLPQQDGVCRGATKDTIRRWVQALPVRPRVVTDADGSEMVVYEVNLFAAHGSIDLLERDLDYLRRALDIPGPTVLHVDQVAACRTAKAGDRCMRVHAIREAAAERAVWQLLDEAVAATAVPGRCLRGHPLAAVEVADTQVCTCDCCETRLRSAVVHRCQECNYDLCRSCAGSTGLPGHAALALLRQRLAAVDPGFRAPPAVPQQLRTSGGPAAHNCTVKWERLGGEIEEVQELRAVFASWLETRGAVGARLVRCPSTERLVPALGGCGCGA